MYNEHLSIEEIEQLIQQKGPAENQNHVENCPQCKSLLGNSQALSEKLDKLASVRIGAESAMKCPDERVWFDVAGGTLPETESLQYVQHAVECTSCVQRLKTATRMFEEELSPEEEQTLAQLLSTAVKIQQKLAHDLAATKTENIQKQTDSFTQKRLGFLSWRSFSWAAATAGLAIAIFSSLALYRQHELHQAQEAVADAYKKGRPMEYRVAGTPYGPVHQERGSSLVLPSLEVSQDRKVPLLAAQAAFLERDSASALAILEKARESGNNSLLILDDLVVAYAMEAERTGLKANYERAIQLSDEIIRQAPSDPTVYFNRGLMFERLDRTEDSIEAFKQFLRFERDANWRIEAEKKLP